MCESWFSAWFVMYALELQHFNFLNHIIESLRLQFLESIINSDILEYRTVSEKGELKGIVSLNLWEIKKSHLFLGF